MRQCNHATTYMATKTIIIKKIFRRKADARMAKWFRTRSKTDAVLRGPSALTWELLTGDCKITLEYKQKIGNLTYYISLESLRDAESE